MNHTVLLRHALQVLHDPESNQKHRDVAASSLVTSAAQTDFAPPGTAAALWKYIRTNPRGSHAPEAADAIGNHLPFDPGVHAEAVEVVKSMESDPRLYESCLTILTGSSYAQQVSPETLLGISECCSRMGRRVILMIPQLVEAVHDQGGGLGEEVIRAIRDKWSRSWIEDHRFESPEIGRLLPTMDLVWLKMMLADPSAQVRRVVATTIPRMADPHLALEVIEERIFVERVHEVLAALHASIEEIILQIEREALRRRHRGQN